MMAASSSEHRAEAAGSAEDLHNTAEQPDLLQSGLVDRVLELSASLRRLDIPLAQSDVLDALRALEHVELLDRDQLREALACVLLSTWPHREVFDGLFDALFPVRTPLSDNLKTAGEPDSPGGSGELEEFDSDEFLEALTTEIGADGDQLASMASQAVDAFGRIEGRQGGEAHFAYRVFRAIDVETLLTELLRRVQVEADSELSPFELQLYRDEFEARIRRFRSHVLADVEDRDTHRKRQRGLAPAHVRRPIDQRDFFTLSTDEIRQIELQLEPLARKLAGRVSARRRRDRSGRLDVRRTVRRSLATGGVPFEPAFRRPRLHKPELFVLCDVSTSVASFTKFTLMLVQALQQRFASVRSFAFVDALDEVTELFAAGDVAQAMERMSSEARIVRRDGHSDYGASFEQFVERYAESLSARSTVLILGDARNNFRQANAWALEHIRRRSDKVYWLNPEPIQFWDTGDSIATNYGRCVDEVVEVRNLGQLSRFVAQIV